MIINGKESGEVFGKIRTGELKIYRRYIGQCDNDLKMGVKGVKMIRKNGVEKMKMTRMELQGKDYSKFGTNRVKIISKKRWNR